MTTRRILMMIFAASLTLYAETRSNLSPSSSGIWHVTHWAEIEGPTVGEGG